VKGANFSTKFMPRSITVIGLSAGELVSMIDWRSWPSMPNPIRSSAMSES